MTPNISSSEVSTHQTFTALMWGLTHPGSVQTWGTDETASTKDGFLAISEALLDLETGFYTPNEALATQIRLTSARSMPVATARYHFYPTLNVDALTDIEQATIGDMLYPDRGATLVIDTTIGAGKTYTLSGPGIKDQVAVTLDGISDQFWEIRNNRLNYPLGWDVFFVDGPQLVGLPRTTTVSY